MTAQRVARYRGTQCSHRRRARAPVHRIKWRRRHGSPHYVIYAASYAAGLACVPHPAPLATGTAPTRRDKHAGLKIRSVRESTTAARGIPDEISVDHSSIMLSVLCYLIHPCWAHLSGSQRLCTCVGTSGLGYPLLLCLGESLIVILDYALTA